MSFRAVCALSMLVVTDEAPRGTPKIEVRHLYILYVNVFTFLVRVEGLTSNHTTPCRMQLMAPFWYPRYSWLQQNEPKIAAGWPHGVVSGLPGGLAFFGAG